MLIGVSSYVPQKVEAAVTGVAPVAVAVLDQRHHHSGARSDHRILGLPILIDQLMGVSNAMMKEELGAADGFGGLGEKLFTHVEHDLGSDLASGMTAQSVGKHHQAALPIIEDGTAVLIVGAVTLQ